MTSTGQNGLLMLALTVAAQNEHTASAVLLQSSLAPFCCPPFKCDEVKEPRLFHGMHVVMSVIM